MFVVDNHLLSGESPQGTPVRFTPSAKHGGIIEPKFLVFHYTACSAATARELLLRHAGSNRVSAHLLVHADDGWRLAALAHE